MIENVADFGEYGEENTGESEIFQVVEDMPSFPGGNVSKWIAKNVKYPVLAMENGIQGKVFIQFVIERDGSITDVKVARGVDASWIRKLYVLCSRCRNGNQESREVNLYV